MKKHFLILLISFCPLFVFSQVVSVEGKLKVSEMDTINAENHLVVKRPDGTLATRMVASLPPPPDTTRTLQSDLLLTSALCNCTGLPPAMIESLLDNGYTIQDLVDFQISILDLIGGGVSIQDLLNGGLSIQDLLNGGLFVQDLLDAEQTPITLYNNGVILDSLYGKTYQGGLIAYLNTTTGSGLIAAVIDQSAGAEWGCYGDEMNTSSPIGIGQDNTTNIVENCAEPEIAARLCDDLVVGIYEDWFLPSKDELNEMYLNLKVNGFGGFTIGWYWSSTEDTPASAWAQYFGNGIWLGDPKTIDYNVRAVRYF